MQWIHLAAYGGVALSAIAVAMLLLVVFFGDLVAVTDRALRRWMDAIMWCLAGGLLSAALAAAWAVTQLHH